MVHLQKALTNYLLKPLLMYLLSPVHYRDIVDILTLTLWSQHHCFVFHTISTATSTSLEYSICLLIIIFYSSSPSLA